MGARTRASSAEIIAAASVPSRARPADGEREAISKAKAKLTEFMSHLGGVAFGDVSIALFSVEVDGHTFGLVDASEPDEDYESIHLLPNDLAFFDPWDGSYDT